VIWDSSILIKDLYINLAIAGVVSILL